MLQSLMGDIRRKKLNIIRIGPYRLWIGLVWAFYIKDEIHSEEIE